MPTAKVTLIMVGIPVLVMGILGAIPGIGLDPEPVRHAILNPNFLNFK